MTASDSNAPVVVITGGSAGVGRALSRLYARRGAAVAILARGADGLAATAREIESLGGRPLTIETDVADADAVEAATERIERELGPIDTWINNAMVSVFSPVREMTAEDYRRVTDVTYLGYVHGALSALRRMLPRDRGTIVFVGSALAYRGIPLQSAYCAAKHAVQGFHDSLRTELEHDRSSVRVTMVQLPAVNTPQFGWVKSRLPHRAQPVPPIFQPELIAEGIAWAADNPEVSRELNIGFPSVKAIWGNKLAPSVADRVLARNGYASQQTDEPEDPARLDNLWHPVPGDHGAHGAFDDRANDSSAQLWANTHRGAVALGAAAVAALAAVTVAGLRRS
jgi:NAD(P)-dependent dehydrogenase (short-subunit alcohol dehydrogenase family)